MRLLDLLFNDRRAGREAEELHGLKTRLLRHADRAEETRHRLCARVLERSVSLSDASVTGAARRCVAALLAGEGHFTVPEIDLSRRLSTVETWELTAQARRQLALFERAETGLRIEETLALLLTSLLADVPPTPPAGADSSNSRSGRG